MGFHYILNPPRNIRNQLLFRKYFLIPANERGQHQMVPSFVTRIKQYYFLYSC